MPQLYTFSKASDDGLAPLGPRVMVMEWNKQLAGA
jgi:hypothetical protein